MVHNWGKHKTRQDIHDTNSIKQPKVNNYSPFPLEMLVFTQLSNCCVYFLLERWKAWSDDCRCKTEAPTQSQGLDLNDSQTCCILTNGALTQLPKHNVTYSVETEQLLRTKAIALGQWRARGSALLSPLKEQWLANKSPRAGPGLGFASLILQSYSCLLSPNPNCLMP